MSESTDLIVIGAGAAGLSAANSAHEMGLSVIIIDEQPEAGGQIYRSVGRVKDQRVAILGDDYTAGRSLLDVLNHDTVTLIDSATVWNIEPDGRVYYSRNDVASVVDAQYIIIATGAMERPMPFPGWELPGVMSAGGAQILLKSSSILPATPTVLAGSGPLLLLVAVQFLRAGHEIEAIVETTPSAQWRRVLPHLFGAVKAHSVLRKGLGFLSTIKKHGITHIKGASGLAAQGDSAVRSLLYNVDGRKQFVACQSLLTHNGVVPNVQLTRLLGLEHDFDVQQRYFAPRTGEYGRTSLEKIAIAGDTAGIGGAEIAVKRGHLAGIGAALALGRIAEETALHHVGNMQRENKVYEAARPFIDALYTPNPDLLNPPDETLICRCEEVTAASVREYVDRGCLGPNQTKAFGRCGMGPCQGRMCGLTVSEIIAAKRNVSVDEVGYYRVRSPIKPVTLKELAAMDDPKVAVTQGRA